MRYPPEFLLLGCGYTSTRVARQLIKNGARVIATNRQPMQLPGARCLSLDAADPESIAKLFEQLSPGLSILHSIPPAGNREEALDYTAALLQMLEPLHPARIVYLSTTGVYGAAQTVDEHTAVAADTVRDRLRVEAENLVTAAKWSSLILRPAAIYGPGRGVHHSVRTGTFKAPMDGGRVISRIHVDDLAAHALAALENKVTGAFPVGDEEPCTSLEVARFTAQLSGIKLNFDSTAASVTSGRRVDGKAIRRLLGITLRYPSYRQGVPASL